MAPRIRLRWTPVNTAHILRHAVRTNEVEEVMEGTYLAEPGYGGRTVVIGRSRTGRYLTIVVEAEGAGQFFPVTARPASRKERRRFHLTYGEQMP